MATQILMCLAFASGLFACTVAIVSLLKWRRNMIVAATSCFASQGNDWHFNKSSEPGPFSSGWHLLIGDYRWRDAYNLKLINATPEKGSGE